MKTKTSISDQMIIRACKSLDSLPRLIKTYHKYYGNFTNEKVYIIQILSRICEDFQLIKVSDLICDLSPENYWKFSQDKDEDYTSRVIKILASKIRFTEVSRFPGFIIPGRYRGNLTNN